MKETKFKKITFTKEEQNLLAQDNEIWNKMKTSSNACKINDEQEKVCRAVVKMERKKLMDALGMTEDEVCDDTFHRMRHPNALINIYNRQVDACAYVRENFERLKEECNKSNAPTIVEIDDDVVDPDKQKEEIKIVPNIHEIVEINKNKVTVPFIYRVIGIILFRSKNLLVNFNKTFREEFDGLFTEEEFDEIDNLFVLKKEFTEEEQKIRKGERLKKNQEFRIFIEVDSHYNDIIRDLSETRLNSYNYYDYTQRLLDYLTPFEQGRIPEIELLSPSVGVEHCRDTSFSVKQAINHNLGKISSYAFPTSLAFLFSTFATDQIFGTSSTSLTWNMLYSLGSTVVSGSSNLVGYVIQNLALLKNSAPHAYNTLINIESFSQFKDVVYYACQYGIEQIPNYNAIYSGGANLFASANSVISSAFSSLVSLNMYQLAGFAGGAIGALLIFCLLYKMAHALKKYKEIEENEKIAQARENLECISRGEKKKYDDPVLKIYYSYCRPKREILSLYKISAAILNSNGSYLDRDMEKLKNQCDSSNVQYYGDMVRIGEEKDQKAYTNLLRSVIIASNEFRKEDLAQKTYTDTVKEKIFNVTYEA